MFIKTSLVYNQHLGVLGGDCGVPPGGIPDHLPEAELLAIVQGVVGLVLEH